MAWVNDPPPELQGDFDRWMAELAARALYENPLGAGHVVFAYWSALGSSLGLPLIAGIYGKGLEAEGHALDRLTRELGELERAWGDLDLSGEDEFAETIHRPDQEPETRSLTLVSLAASNATNSGQPVRWIPDRTPATGVVPCVVENLGL